MEEALAEQGVDCVDGIVFDLGVSSMQLDEAKRGFSFMNDGPLSMRMDGGKPDAADVIADADVLELASIFKIYGEERRSKQIARAIVAAREKSPIETTSALVGVIATAAHQRAGMKIHPATKVFQALRIFVNDEFGQLAAGLRAAEQLLRPAGRLVVVAFHSLEDRAVKHFFANRFEKAGGGSRHFPPRKEKSASFSPVYTKALVASGEEVALNPRARSAKLRAGVRLAAAPMLDAPLIPKMNLNIAKFGKAVA